MTIPSFIGDRLIGVVDLDGVVVNFNDNYLRLCSALVGKELKFGEKGEPTTWYYAKEEFGIPDVIVEQSWRVLHQDPTWWMNLAPLNDATCVTLNALQNDVTLYFVTARQGPNVKRQTEQWLQRYVGLQTPTVIISEKKGQVVEAVGAHFIIEDRPENLMQCVQLENTPQDPLRFLVRHAYNEWAWDNEQFVVVDGVTEAFGYIEKEGLWLPKKSE